eukprot:TRINITY_DN989_c0_g1_i3.p1 TRINITY_DN989_c0_g1~~TRINITY_DN989_c0_g1_i3.p1  ORF type:complete len:204 (+),score=43.48 TRINITY_DN989_c0_g1_i3:38-649(+)
MSSWVVVQGRPLTEATLSYLSSVGTVITVEAGKVVHVEVPQPESLAAIREHCAENKCDVGVVPLERDISQFKLYVTDMDSTLITIECIDEIADVHGLKDQVAAITEKAMKGELNFTESLHSRVALLKGLKESALSEVYEKRLTISPNGRSTIKYLRDNGLKTLLVSGGFTYFTDRSNPLLLLPLPSPPSSFPMSFSPTSLDHL